MRFWKVIIVLTLPYFVLGCCKCAEYITVSNYSYCSIQTNNIDTSLVKSNLISTADTIAKNNYGIQLWIEMNEGNCLVPTSIFTSAYACKCPEPYLYVPDDSVLRFTIRTINDFDTGHSANDTINSYFQHFQNDSYYTLNEFRQNELAQEQGGGAEISAMVFNLQLMQAPQVSGKHAFKIELLLSDNRLLTAATKEVYLK